MILFSRKKKIQRDRNAGLVFRWRGGSGGNTGGLTLAVILATGVFAIGMLGFKVSISRESAPSRYRASVTHVSKMDPSLRWSLERNAPYLSSWQSDHDDEGLLSVQRKMYGLINEAQGVQLEFNKVDFDQAALSHPKLYREGGIVIPGLSRFAEGEGGASEGGAETGVYGWCYVISAPVKEMELRLPEQREYVTGILGLEDYLGETIRFTVNLDASGEVVSSLPLNWSSDDEMTLVENWINTLDFKAGKVKAGVETIMVSVTLTERRRSE